MMAPELKDAWVAALRSGQYEQGQFRLVKDGETLTFCCLGVLCEIQGLQRETVERGDLEKRLVFVFDGLDDVAGEREVCYAALPSRTCVDWGISDSKQSELILLNDINKKSFSEIADFIEADAEL